jgi:uncharacterized lipoprotein YajG
MTHCPFYSERTSVILKITLLLALFLLTSCSLKDYTVIYNNHIYKCDSKTSVNLYTDCVDSNGNFFEEITIHSGIILSHKEK